MRPLLQRTLAALAVLAASCSSYDFDPGSKVESVRVLAVRADQPYALPGATVHLDVLAFDGRKDRSRPMSIYWFPHPCFDPQGDGYYACYAAMQAAYARGVDLTSQLEVGTTFSFQVPADVIANHQGNRGDIPYGVAIVFLMACAGHVESVPPPAGAGPAAMPFGCFDESRHQLGADDFVFAYSTVFSFTSRTNANPVIDHLTLGGARIDPTAGITLPHCTDSTIDNCPTVQVDTVVPDSSQEVDPGNTDADGHVLKEEIWVDYLVTNGKVKNDVEILFDPRAGRLSSPDDLYAPQTPGDYWLWSVVRDNRGGVAWQAVPLHAH